MQAGCRKNLQQAYPVLATGTSIWTAYGWLYIVNVPLINNPRKDNVACLLVNMLTIASVAIGTLSLGRAYYLAFPNVEEFDCLQRSTFYHRFQFSAGVLTSGFFAGMGALGVSTTLESLLDGRNGSTYAVAVAGGVSGVVFVAAQLSVLIRVRVIPKKFMLITALINGVCNGFVMFKSSNIRYPLSLSIGVGAITLVSATSFFEQHLRLASGIGENQEDGDDDPEQARQLPCQKTRAVLGFISIIMYSWLISSSSSPEPSAVHNDAGNSTNTTVHSAGDVFSCENLDPNLLHLLPWWLNAAVLMIGFFPLNAGVFLSTTPSGSDDQLNSDVEFAAQL